MSQRHHSNQDKEFKIATSNLLNFALPHRTFYDNMDAYTDDQYQRKLNGLSELLRNAGSDIYALQEVWDEQALQDLAVKLGFERSQVLAPMASNDPSSQLTQGKGAQGTPALGIISKFEVIEWQQLTDFDPLAVVDVPDQGLYRAFNRPPLSVTLDVYGQPITVVTAHLKSKRPHYLRDEQGNRLEDYDDPRVRVRAKLRSLCMRAAEAAALRIFMIDILRNTNHPLILLGDMNDVTDSVTTQLLAETSEVIYDKTMRDVALFDAARIQTSYGWMRDVAYTHLYQGMPEVIDQLFVSEEFLVDGKFSLGEVKQVDYFNDHLKKEYDNRFSDHGIVRAKIELS
ncbi:endonuclease/exonuclease/phosphatase family protein [Psychrobacter sp. FDAARGOS_221]|uniref:endonuclease/exonuclease/phosphatase family protein n=1 Tax=Psychrobacter sp. FDAARGOS_221 TaxID=1975705 RepID=UPI000BB549C6|nr:endonuclease/exonuclease/phosphatase family protein [Psychrobacter sp. FDAARGOS_221]PNK60007.1 endonuclease/exonuclease/phosphatase family protein [Psychrobacter sp. FDAARGOS_221]